LKSLKVDADDLDIIRSIWPVDPDRPAHLLPQLTFLIELLSCRLKKTPRDTSERTKERLGVLGSALQWLIHTLLPPVYEKHFRKEPGISRESDGKPGGPYFRFCHQVLAEFKIECSDESIAKYYYMGKF
jgi:hypothetical protein